jgi:dihydropteroate synthase
MTSEQEKLTLRPLGISAEKALGEATRPLAGGPLCFSACETSLRGAQGRGDHRVLSLPELEAWATAAGHSGEAQALLEVLAAPRAPWAGLDLASPKIMGIINVTPDSFSDGGDRLDSGRAIADGFAMLEAGADILDVGGESTRPGAAPVTLEEELARVIPVIRELAGAGALVSIDSCHADVMAAALDAGARIVNDVTALTGSAGSLALVAEAQVPVVLMHILGEPRSMQVAPRYRDVALDIYDYLGERLAACQAAGIPRERITIDPGIGFGKTVAHNLQLLDRLALFHGLGCAVLLGASRKSFIGRLSKSEPPKERLAGSLAAALAAVARGVQILRVHDVAETKQALTVWQAIVTKQEVLESAT